MFNMFNSLAKFNSTVTAALTIINFIFKSRKKKGISRFLAKRNCLQLSKL